MLKKGKVISFFKETAKNSIILTEDLLDRFAEEYIQGERGVYENVTFEQYVEYKLWLLNPKINQKSSLLKRKK